MAPLPRRAAGVLSTLHAPLPIPVLQSIAALLLAIHAVLVLGMEPQFDEAYYWMWGQFPDLSYYDHPPLNSWLMGLSSWLFGWTIFALRAPTWLALAGTILVLAAWSRRLAGDQWWSWFWTALVVYLASPLIACFSSLMYADYLLFFLCLAAAYCFAGFMADWEAGRPRFRYLFAAALLFGLAGLTKYNAIFLAIGVPIYLLTSAKRRSLFADWRLYAAGLSALLMVSPVLVWNAQHDFASFRFHLGDRYDGAPIASITNLKFFLLLSLLWLSPLLFGPFLRMLFDRWTGGFASAAHGLARTAFVTSTAAFAGLSLFTGVLPYWNVVAYLVAFPLMPHYVRAGWHQALHAAYGLVFAGAMAVHFVVAPLGALTGSSTDDGNFGWREVAAAVRAAEAETSATLIASDSYGGAALLGFALGRRDVVPLAGQLHQYQYWFDFDSFIGTTALIVTGTTPLDGAIAARFESVSLLESIEIRRWGLAVDGYNLWLATGFRG